MKSAIAEAQRSVPRTADRARMGVRTFVPPSQATHRRISKVDLSAVWYGHKGGARSETWVTREGVGEAPRWGTRPSVDHWPANSKLRFIPFILLKNASAHFDDCRWVD
jgi:hypothetical protein